MSTGIEKTILEAAERPANDRDPEGKEPRRSPSPTLSQKGASSDHLEFDRLQLSSGAGYTSGKPQEHQTGPKGVLADYRASRKPSEKAWTVEEILERDEQDQLLEEDDFMADWRRKRLRELQGDQAFGPTFGHFREIGLTNFEHAVLQEDPSVKVVLHLFEAVSSLRPF
jgi:hypothetical protein